MSEDFVIAGRNLSCLCLLPYTGVVKLCKIKISLKSLYALIR